VYDKNRNNRKYDKLKMDYKLHIVIVWLLFGTFGLQAQQQLTNLPTFYLTTQDRQTVSDKVNWVPGNIRIISSDNTENLNMPVTIRGRGNSTWNFAKKPYRIKLDSKQNLLNLPAKEKNWVLLANHADKTLIRNAVAFKIGQLLGFEFTPSARFVDVYLNKAQQWKITPVFTAASSHLPVNIYRIDGRCIYVARFGENKYLDIRLEEAGIQTGIYVIKVGNSVSKLIVK
jgi:hypothetical protein